MEDEDYHVVMVFLRKKDNQELHKSTVCLFQEVEKIKRIKEKIPLYETIADIHGGRVYISVNARNMRATRKDLMIRMIQTEDSQNHESNIQSQLFSSLMRCPKKETKKYMIDIDDEDKVGEIEHILGDNKIEYRLIQTPNGYHAICNPFDIRLVEDIPDVEIKKDGMTYLEYIE